MDRKECEVMKKAFITITIVLALCFAFGAWAATDDEPNDSIIAINAQPQASNTVTEGNIFGYLLVDAITTDGKTLNYQWYYNDSASNSGGMLIDGATDSSFTIPTVLTEGTYYYYCVLSVADAEDVTSDVAKVSVEDDSGCNSAGTTQFLFALLGAALFKRG